MLTERNDSAIGVIAVTDQRLAVEVLEAVRSQLPGRMREAMLGHDVDGNAVRLDIPNHPAKENVPDPLSAWTERSRGMPLNVEGKGCV